MNKIQKMCVFSFIPLAISCKSIWSSLNISSGKVSKFNKVIIFIRCDFLIHRNFHLKMIFFCNSSTTAIWKSLSLSKIYPVLKQTTKIILKQLQGKMMIIFIEKSPANRRPLGLRRESFVFCDHSCNHALFQKCTEGEKQELVIKGIHLCKFFIAPTEEHISLISASQIIRENLSVFIFFFESNELLMRQNMTWQYRRRENFRIFFQFCPIST